MKYYKNKSGDVFALNSEPDKGLSIEVELVALSSEEVKTHLNQDKTNEQKIEAFKVEIQNILDAKAQSLNYDDINSVAKYIGFENHFKNECTALALWASNVWLKSYEMLNAWEAGDIEELTLSEIIEQLPEFES
jgi:hypothetical protein